MARLQTAIALLPLAFAVLSSSQAVAQTKEPTAKLIAKGNLLVPQFSPDGTRLLATGDRMSGIAEIGIASGDVRRVLDEARVGVHSHYRVDGTIAFRARRAGKIRDLTISTEGIIRELREAKPKTFARSNRIFLRTKSGLLAVSHGDRFFAPILSPDQSKIAFTGLETGVHVYDIKTRKQIHIGVGTAPAWSPDSQILAFERTEDDGHNIVGSEIWLWSPEGGARPLTHTETLIERHPSWAPNGASLAFDDDAGALYIIEVARQ